MPHERGTQPMDEATFETSGSNPSNGQSANESTNDANRLMAASTGGPWLLEAASGAAEARAAQHRGGVRQ